MITRKTTPKHRTADNKKRIHMENEIGIVMIKHIRRGHWKVSAYWKVEIGGLEVIDFAGAVFKKNEKDSIKVAKSHLNTRFRRK